MRPGSLIWRASNWLARGNNAFNTLLYVTVPPLLAIIATGFF